MIMLEQKRKTANELIRLKQDKQEDDEEDESIEKEDEGSWKPWLVSLSIDLLSRTARHMQPMSSLERDESKRRDYLFIYYLFRGPIYLKFTRQVQKDRVILIPLINRYDNRILLDKFCNATEHRPLISVITGKYKDDFLYI
jgi:peroxin-16